MTKDEFLDKLGKIQPWLVRASLLVSVYFAYRVITPESVWGWLLLPFLGIIIFFVLEQITQKLENIF